LDDIRAFAELMKEHEIDHIEVPGLVLTKSRHRTATILEKKTEPLTPEQQARLAEEELFWSATSGKR
jgi:hypothetical protein